MFHKLLKNDLQQFESGKRLNFRMVLTTDSWPSCISPAEIAIATKDITISLANGMDCHGNINVIKVLAIPL